MSSIEAKTDHAVLDEPKAILDDCGSDRGKLGWTASTIAEVPRRLIIIDPGLVDTIGHCIQYDEALLDVATAHGLCAIVLTHRKFNGPVADGCSFLPTFSASFWGEKLALNARLFRLPRTAVIYAECVKALRANNFGPGDLTFCHMVAHRNLLPLALLAAGLRSHARPRMVLLFRYPISFCKPERLAAKLSVWLLRRAYRSGTLRVATDSARLARDYEEWFGIPFEVFPIPHTQPSTATADSRPRRLRIGSLGNPRRDKGFDELVDALLLLAKHPLTSDVEFIIQTGSPERRCQPSLQRLREAGLASVTLIERPLSSTEYGTLLSSLDIVVIPYQQEDYRSRTSGVFVEAVAAGKPVIVTASTWMADELRKWGAGIVIPTLSSAALAQALVETVERFSALWAQAAAGSGACRAYHCPESMLRALLQGGERVDRLEAH